MHQFEFDNEKLAKLEGRSGVGVGRLTVQAPEAVEALLDDVLRRQEVLGEDPRLVRDGDERLQRHAGVVHLLRRGAGDVGQEGVEQPARGLAVVRTALGHLGGEATLHAHVVEDLHEAGHRLHLDLVELEVFGVEVSHCEPHLSTM